jgi:ankyrin repeat protein
MVWTFLTLTFAALKAGQKDTFVALLSERPALWAATDSFGSSLGHLACQRTLHSPSIFVSSLSDSDRQAGILRWILQKGQLDPNKKDLQGLTLMHWAALGRDLTILDILLDLVSHPMLV